MAMFNTSGREAYDALYSTLQQPADVSALEREQTPGFLEGEKGGSLWQGVKSAVRRVELGAVANAEANGGLPPQAELFGIGRELEAGVYGEQARQSVADMRASLQARKTEIAKVIQGLRPDPKTNGLASQLLFGVTDVLGTVAMTAGNPYAAGGLYGYTQAQVGMAEGLDPLTANVKGGIEGLAMGVSVALPAALAGGLGFRAASGAALNVGVGIPERFAVSTLLRSRGYEEMAKQYAPLDATSIATELVLGAAFGGLLGPRAKAPKLPAPEDIPPSVIDAALTGNQNRHAEVDTAPGVPTDTRSREAHTQALNQAVESLVMGRGVSVENLLKDAGFLGKRPDFDALRIIADELDKAGAADVVAQVRALEAEARARGLVVDEDTLGSVVLSDKPVETAVMGSMVRESSVRIGDDKVPTQLVLVEAGDVQATMMKADNQFRDRTRVASEQQIADIAARLDAALLMDAPVMDYGAPVLAADGTVIGGNGRAAAVNRAYELGTAGSYREALRAEFGDVVDGMQAPMLVRVLQREVDVQKAAILSNEGGGLRMSALEQAKVDAERLGDLRGVEFTDDGMADMTTIRSWVGQMPQNQRAAIMDADGRLSAEGATRLRNAVLYKAYGDSPTLARLVESTDPGSRNIAAALTRAAPAVADAKEAIARGDLYPIGLHDDLIAAVERLDGLRRDGLAVDDWVKQIDAFGDGMTPEARLLVQFMDRNIRASRTISDGVFGFYNRLLELGDPKQGSMFEAAQPDKMRMLTMALEGDAPMYGRGAGARSLVADLETGFRAMFGKDADRLLETGRVRIVQSVRDLPGSGHPDDVGGMFWRGEAWIVADNTGLSQIRGRALHEVGEHAGMQQMLGDALYQQVLDTVARKAETDPVFQQARALAEARANRPEHVPAETLAYLLENAPELPIVRRILAAVRQWVYRTTGGRFVDLTQADLQMMAVASLRRYAREAEVAAKGEDAPWYMTLFHGSPTAFKPEEGAPLGRLRWRFINTGEGAQAFGYGHYLAQQEWIARTRYRDRLVERKASSATMTLLSDSVVNRIREGLPEELRSAFDMAAQMIRDGKSKQEAWKAASESVGAKLLTDPRVEAMDDALGQLNASGTFEISAKDDPAYRIGDRIVHANMGGEEGGIAWAIQNIKQGTSVEEVKGWATTDLAADREALARIERAFTLKKQGNEWVVFHPDGKEAERGFASRADAQQALDSYNAGFLRQAEAKADHLRDQIARAEGALRVLDDLTIEIPERVVDGQLFDEAQRVLRPDIQEVRPEAPKGALYGKFIPDETWQQMMIWDAPLSAQPENVRAAFAKLGIKDEPMPKWTVRDDGYLELQSGRNTLLIKELKAPSNIDSITSFLGVSFKEVGKGWPAPWELTWRDGSKGYYKSKDVIRSVLEREWLLDQYGIESPSFAVYRNGKLSSTEKTLDEAKSWALEFAGIRDLTGELAYRRLVKTFDDTKTLDPGGELDDFIMMADMEIKSRRAPEGTDPAEFEYTPGSDEMISVILSDLGIPGHRFLDGETRAAGWDSPDARFNVVLYSDDLGRVAWEAKGEAGQQPTEWVAANGRARVVKMDDGANGRFAVEIDGKEIDYELSLEPALRIAEQALDGQLYSRGDTMQADPLEDTTLPDARLLSDQADAEIATATELSQGFLPAAECALRVGA